MKKVILVVAMVFATSSLVNANTSEVSEYKYDEGCALAAWDYGTKYGGDNEAYRYKLTNSYYESCISG